MNFQWKRARNCVVKIQQNKNIENYFAFDDTSLIRQLFPYKKDGELTKVEIDKKLLKRMDSPASKVIYHHSHPDSRSLSPSDLGILARPGLTEIWAHSPCGCSYGAGRLKNVGTNQFSTALNTLLGFHDINIIQNEQSLHQMNLMTNDVFQNLRDISTCRALFCKNYIYYMETLTDAQVTYLNANFADYQFLLFYFISKI